MRVASYYLSFVIVTSACGEASETAQVDGDVVDADGSIELAGACAQDSRLGGFSLTVDNISTLSSYAAGEVYDRVFPNQVYELVYEEGPCKVLAPNAPQCDPLCSPSEICDFDESCRPQPRTQNVGTVSFLGLDDALAIEPAPPANIYFAVGLAHPVVVPGQHVELRATGGVFGDFSMRGYGVSTLPMSIETVRVEENMATTLLWQASDDPHARIDLRMTIDQHGVTPHLLSCIFEDTGSADVPVAAVNALYSAGISGWPNVVITRRTTDAVELDAGCIDFSVQAAGVTLTVEVAGHQPCSVEEDCAPGFHCDFVMQTCVPD